MENNSQNKQRFMAQYWGQKVGTYIERQGDALDIVGPEIMEPDDWGLSQCLQLKPLSAITDKDAIEVAKMATHLHDNPNWKVVKIAENKGMKKVYFSDGWTFDTSKEYYVKVAPFPLQGTFISYKGEILEQHHYQFELQAYDYLRSKGYLLPFMDLSIEQILEYKWAVIK